MKRLNFTEKERAYFNSATQEQAQALWKSNTGKKLKSRLCAVTWCIVMGFVQNS